MNWHIFLSPPSFYRAGNIIAPIAAAGCLLCLLYGTIGGLWLAPPDYQQGEGFRIIYVHVPAALTAMAVYLVMAISALSVLVFRIKLAAICMSESARIGVWFTALALITGSLWGKPMWGTFWVWDARLTSVLILLFLYLGFIVLQSVIPDRQQRERSSAILALLGAINLPVIHYSVIWWHTLHQGPSISRFAKPAIAAEMLWPLLAMITGFLFFYVFALVRRMQNQLLLREMRAQWVRELVKA